MSARLTGQVAVVTGGAQSIGAAIADGLAAAGATVVVGDLQDSPDHPTIRLDVSDEGSVVSAVAEIVADHGQLDIVVNNAGIMFEAPVPQQDLSSWNRMLAINLTGPMLMIKHAAPHLAATGGAIINVGSIEGDRCNPAHAAYAATKSGVHGLTRAAAIDLGPTGVRCNAVAPGWIDTPLNASYVDAHPDRESVIEALAELHPIGRVGDPSDVADVVVWLASDDSRFVTGQVITIDGGRTARPPLPGMLQ
ncbi:MAG: SDR family oxidoreductase [Acidimicrobiia bacterium]|nr:SDR family oxidoreductase [Acidimicrobiia bacterium]